MISRIADAHRRMIEARDERNRLITIAVDEGRKGERIAQGIAEAVGADRAITGQAVRMIARKQKDPKP